MAFLEHLHPVRVVNKYVRKPVELFILKQFLDYKERTNKGLNSVKELLIRAAIVTVFVTAILWISVFMYVVFYYTYMPNVTHVRPVHLQFKWVLIFNFIYHFKPFKQNLPQFKNNSPTDNTLKTKLKWTSKCYRYML